MIDEQFSTSQIVSILKLWEGGMDTNELCRKHKISVNELNIWKVRYGSVDTILERLKVVEEENYILKGKLADNSIQKNASKTGDTDHIYRILASNIPGTAITILDREERYLLAEGDFLLTMGYEKESLPGKKISEVISPDNYELYYKEVIKKVFAGEIVLTERKTFTGHYTLMKAVPLKAEGGGIFAIMFVLIDVTPLKKAQLDLKNINEDLEIKIQERTNQLIAANRQLEIFSYSISHDLQAPLRSISGFAKILKEDFSEKIKDLEFDKVADRLINNALKMERLINDLLNFSRIERKDLSKSDIDVDKMVREIIQEHTIQASIRKFDIVVPLLHAAQGDTNLIRQVWVNLISNAIKYTNKKPIAAIEINNYIDGSMVCYSVADNGAGFDMAYSDKLFGVFQRLHRASDFEGTGVGLALAKSIIQRHGGNIWAESIVDIGTTFYFTLPVSEKETNATN